MPEIDCLTFKSYLKMNRTLWQTILNIIIAVASAIVGALGGSMME